MRKYYKVIIPIVLVCVVALIVVIIHNNNSEKSFSGSEGVSNSNLNEPKIDDEEVKIGDTINGYLFDSEDVNFDNTGSGLLSTNAQDAIDELYRHATDYNSMDTRVTALEGLIVENAGNHNSIYRGKDVTSYLTDGTLFTRISSGKFTDLYVGDYVVKNNVTWRIAGFDIYYEKGDSCDNGTACMVHHAVIVPDTILTTAQMNTSNTTSGGYVGSRMYTTTLPTVLTTIRNAFGTNHVLKYRALLSNAINTSAANRYPGTSGASSEWAWYDAYVNLMNTVQVTGNIGFSSSAFDTGADNIQFPLFRLRPAHIIAHKSSNKRTWYYARDVSTSEYFVHIDTSGFSKSNATASDEGGVRPYFYID